MFSFPAPALAFEAILEDLGTARTRLARSAPPPTPPAPGTAAPSPRGATTPPRSPPSSGRPRIPSRP